MFLRPSRSLNARIRALLGTRSFASSPDAIGPRGQGVPVLTRIRRMISSLFATRTAHPLVLAQRAILLKVLEGLSSCASSFTRETTECVTEEKTRQTFFPAVGILSGICLVLLLLLLRACLSFGTHRSPERSLCLLAKQRTRSFDCCVSRKAALFFVGLFLAPRRSCARE